MKLSKSVDLRSNLDRVYSQGSQGSCGPHATTANLDILYERDTNIPHRFDKQSIYDNCHYFMGQYGDNVGINFPAIEYVAKKHGFICLEPPQNPPESYFTGFEVARVNFLANGWDSYKHLLASGIPIVLVS